MLERTFCVQHTLRVRLALTRQPPAEKIKQCKGQYYTYKYNYNNLERMIDL